MDICWIQSRWNKRNSEASNEDGDYINCPMTKERVPRLPSGIDGRREDRVPRVGEADTPYFEGCMPIEVMACARGGNAPLWPDEAGRARRSARSACPEFPQGRWPYAVVQLRQDNKLGTLVEHGRLPDQAEIRRAGRAVPHDSRAARTRNSHGSAGCTATPSSTRRWCSTDSCGCATRRTSGSPGR